MNKQDIITKNVGETVDLINIIGELGNNEITEFTIKDYLDNDIVVFLSKEGNGSKYHFYNHSLIIKYSDNNKLIIETKALENSEECPYTYATNILVTHQINGKNYRLCSYIYGWNYDNLLNFTDKNFIQTMKHLTNQENDIKGPYTLNTNQLIDIVGDGEKRNIIDIIDSYICFLIDQKNDDNKKMDELLDTLSNNEIKTLKKKLSIYNK